MRNLIAVLALVIAPSLAYAGGDCVRSQDKPAGEESATADPRELDV